MPTSEAQIRANQQNALRSTGPRTPEGKAISRANSLKHGLTGEGVVLPNEDVADVERRLAAFREEFQPSDEVSAVLVRRAAILSVRLDRCASYETATLSGRIRQAETDFLAPEGLDASTVSQLRAEAKARAMFDASPEASLARQYETATERSFYKAIKELRLRDRQLKAPEPATEHRSLQEEMGSILELQKMLDQLKTSQAESTPMPSPLSPHFSSSPLLPSEPSRFDIPITIGRRC